MAETNNTSGGESTTNTTSSTTGSTGGSTGGRGTGNTAGNTTTKSSGDASGLSSANTPDANLENETMATKSTETTQMPYPHSALSSIQTEASSYRDLIKDVYKEHEKEMSSEKANSYEPSAEMLAAREDAQVRLASELRASLKAQRSMTRKGATEGGVTIKLSKAHIHDGVAYEAGDEISVDETSASFIEEAKVGKKV